MNKDRAEVGIYKREGVIKKEKKKLTFIKYLLWALF